MKMLLMSVMTKPKILLLYTKDFSWKRENYNVQVGGTQEH